MCGISGIIGMRAPRAAIEGMTGKLRHRGPDAGDVFLDEEAALGHRRLSIIDLSVEANQPMHDASGRYVLVYNGELYNFREVRAKLPQYPFRTASDSEVVLAAYATWGAECLRQFNGIFAFAIWDRQKKNCFIARDRLGVKPLYYYHSGGLLAFASEIRSILASGLVSHELDPAGVRSYFLYQSAIAPHTVIRGIKCLLPGEYALFRSGTLEKNLYWRVDSPPPVDAGADPDGIRRQTRRLLTESVERRMLSDVPLGAFLSGGIDSSAVVGLMAECSEQPVNTFSVTFDEAEFDESEYSSLIARRFNTRHTPIRLRARDFPAALPAALDAIDNPSGDGINTFVVSKTAKEAGITVALSGIGGDELFAGYAAFGRWLRLRNSGIWHLPDSLRRAGSRLLSAAGNARAERLGGMLAAPGPEIEYLYPLFRQVIAPRRADALLGNAGAQNDVLHDLLAERGAALRRLPPLGRYTAAELLGYTSNVLLKDADQMGMASALEIREPFFDHLLVEYLIQVPDRFKIGRDAKSLLVDALTPLLPEQIVRRPKKGFTLPWKYWLKNELREWCIDSVNGLAERPMFNPVEIRKRLNRFLADRGSGEWMTVFQMAILEHWLRKNIDDAGIHGRPPHSRQYAEKFAK